MTTHQATTAGATLHNPFLFFFNYNLLGLYCRMKYIIFSPTTNFMAKLFLKTSYKTPNCYLEAHKKTRRNYNMLNERHVGSAL